MWPASKACCSRRSRTVAPWFISRIASCGASAPKLWARRRSSYASTAAAAASANATSHGWWLKYSISRSIASRANPVEQAGHYSRSGSGRPRRSAPWHCRRSAAHVEYSAMRSGYLAPIAMLVTLLLPSAPLDAAAPAKTEAELRTLREKIGRITQQVSRDALERDRLSGNLRAAELSVGQARDQLGHANREYAERSARRAALAQSRMQQQQGLLNERAALAAQLRVAYMI